nr:sigma 54-interacting transcriptional regulator [Heyndrickxia oleronia]
MSESKLHIISIQERYLATITKQLKEVFRDLIQLSPTTIKDLQNNTIEPGDVVILSSDILIGFALQFIPEGCQYIIAKREINYANMKEVIELPPGRKILVVNDTLINTNETVDSLRETFSEHQYFAYDPSQPIPEFIDYIITPDETHLLPGGLGKVIDIGMRLLDIEVFLEVAKLLDLSIDSITLNKRYMKSLISLSKSYSSTQSNDQKKIVKDVRDTAGYHFSDMIARSSKMQIALEQAKIYAQLDQPIHLYGEAGTGKKMLAQAIHNASKQHSGPFVVINCAFRTHDLLEKDLFGVENGTDITIGVIEMAQGGTLYIESVNELPVFLQKRLLQVIHTNKLERKNGKNLIDVNVRIITSSLYSLEEMQGEGYFEQEKHVILTPYSIYMPSLLERIEDIDDLIVDIKTRLHRKDLSFTEEVMQRLKTYKWKGNIKELYNTVSYLSFLDQSLIETHMLPLYLKEEKESYHSEQDVQEINMGKIIEKIEEHGFLEESISILKVFQEGKQERESFGRTKLKARLIEKGIDLTEQQLRMRLEVLQELKLLNVRQGRAGTTISRLGERFLANYEKQVI